ncbi:type 2 lanthipeptide synthetase LanM family protein [Actinocatenispora rupis]|uniref:Lanthionine synthetase n=1 Tax=Actinocatenispora rupis TaxID=519421 RepID=A0A8J3J693_9ACTN|nr:type 2 lanthipeptide synthetase LanM family protein [Actinocatenispora rupis]GID10839.1 lanthionine synthetase [Actinocatenispora rupis]
MDQLRRAAARAVPLAERGTPPDPDAGTERSRARAARILARWRAQPPFDSGDAFARRLAADGTDEAAVAAWLAAPPDEPVRGGWVDRLVAAFERPAAADPVTPPPGYEFAALVSPLLTDARDRLRAAVPGRAADVALLVPALAVTAHEMATRTMLLELNVARVTERLTADTPRGRYAEFVAGLGDPAVAVPLLAEYPVLARLLTTAADQWVRAGAELLTRLAADRAALAETFGGGADPGPVAAIRTGLGDRHRDGRAVALVDFASGLRVVYKPRSVAVDGHVAALVDWLNGQLARPLRMPVTLARDGYGWVEHVAAHPSDDPAAFYHRAGSLLAVLYLLDAVDCHAQNLVAAGNQPVLVDLETALQPQFPDRDKDLGPAEVAARDGTLHSVLRSGLLPQRSWTSGGDGGTDVSALGYAPGADPGRPAPAVAGAGTDTARVAYRRTPLAGMADARPGATVHPVDHLSDVDSGFAEAYRILAGDKGSVRKLLGAFAGDEIRLLRRDTLEYGSLLRAGLHPDLLRDALDRDRHLDRLWVLADRQPGVADFLPYERDDLWRNDIPLFTVRADGVDAVSTTGATIPRAVPRSALDAVLDRLDRLDEADLARQRDLCAAAITAVAPTETAPTGYPFTPTTPDAVRERAVAAAARVGDELVRLAYRADGELAWVGPNLTADGWVLAPLGPELYGGTAGPALFLAYLDDATGGYGAAADGAARTLRRQVDRRAETLTGGYGSAGGVLYALALLHARRPSPEYSGLAARLVRRIAATAGDDATLDVLGGCAGSIGGLIAWYATDPAGAVRDAVRRCADRLCATARPGPVGHGWLPDTLASVADRPPAGFAHGAAGCAWALDGAATLLGDERYAAAAADARAYERTLFDEDAGTWWDVRVPRDSATAYPVAWCHGATGVGLSRLGVPGASDELTAARATVLRAGFGHDFSLCHGDLGNLDLLLSTSDSAADRYLAGILDGLDEYGWLGGMPRGGTGPGLLVGLAGIGYGLLRAASPATVPSVLRMSR